MLPNVTSALPDEGKVVIQKYLHHLHTHVCAHTQRDSNITCGCDDLAVVEWWCSINNPVGLSAGPHKGNLKAKIDQICLLFLGYKRLPLRTSIWGKRWWAIRVLCILMLPRETIPPTSLDDLCLFNLCVYVWAPVSLCAPGVRTFPWNQYRGDCKSPCEWWQPNSGLLQNQEVF